PRTLDELDENRRRDLAASFQRAAVLAVRKKLERALERDRYAALIAGGGVTANSALRRELAEITTARGITLRLPELRFCVDNAAMIAGLGHERLAAGESDDLTLTPVPTTAC
ncbi:MAG: tRNA (adenosine(37)-N6)-threonylcarbamoyltransferase complex transferase subunit TsaD, partial [Planctomycetota bacterium]